MGVVHPESSETVAGMFSFRRNDINIFTSSLLPDLGLGGACFGFLKMVKRLQGETFCFREVLIMNCLSTQLRAQQVVSIRLVRVVVYGRVRKYGYFAF